MMWVLPVFLMQRKKSGYRIAGDVKFDEVAPKCSYITTGSGWSRTDDHCFFVDEYPEWV